jgi:hypothetical protein
MTAPLYETLSTFWAARSIPMAIPAPYRHMQSPTMTIRNRLFASDAFSKIHVEHAATAAGLDILHSVAFPRHGKDAPILGMDLVCVKGAPTMGICDLTGGGLEGLLRYPPKTTRELPDWGRPLFSKQCVFVDRPDLAEFSEFLERAARTYAAAVEALPPAAPEHRRRYRQNFKVLYRDAQCQNPRTFAVLAAAFGPDLAARYMEEVMFG